VGARLYDAFAWALAGAVVGTAVWGVLTLTGAA
jgi:hypothetical protein